MTAAELRAILDRAMISRRDLAVRLDVTERTIDRWLAGTTPIPQTAAIAIMSVLGKQERKAR
jgi:DNA-binding transcriptional regulator YiaG